MTRMMLFIIILLISTSSYSAEKRFGVGAKVYDSVLIYFPVEVNGGLIEPSLEVSSSERESNSYGSTADSSYRRINIGVGFFKSSPLLKDTTLNLGSRFGYVFGKSESNSSGSVWSDESNGYFIAPTAGVAYAFTPQFSLGMDFSIRYSKNSRKFESSSGMQDSSSESVFRTYTDVIVRYMFE